MNNTNNSTPKTVCRNGDQCTRKNCRFGHSDTFVPTCVFGDKCRCIGTDDTCQFVHSKCSECTKQIKKDSTKCESCDESKAT
jgi:hypothetical protein